MNSISRGQGISTLPPVLAVYFVEAVLHSCARERPSARPLGALLYLLPPPILLLEALSDTIRPSYGTCGRCGSRDWTTGFETPVPLPKYLQMLRTRATIPQALEMKAMRISKPT